MTLVHHQTCCQTTGEEKLSKLAMMKYKIDEGYKKSESKNVNSLAATDFCNIL